MRINRFVASASGLSRRGADKAIVEGRVFINGTVARIGQEIQPSGTITLDGSALILTETIVVALNKPVGYVCSRDGQGSKTLYDLLPKKFYHLKPIGRLDKDSSGLILLTNDGQLSNELTHPRFHKDKSYEIRLNRELEEKDKQKITKGIQLDDGISVLSLSGKGLSWNIKMTEGRNRQIRRTFAAIGYTVISLHRISFGKYSLTGVEAPGSYRILERET